MAYLKDHPRIRKWSITMVIVLVHGSWFMVRRKAAYRPLGMQGASGLRDTPGHTSRSLQRTNVYKVNRVKNR